MSGAAAKALGCLALVLGLSAAAEAFAHPVLDGVWVLKPGQAPGLVNPGGDPAPLNDKGRSVFEARQQALAAGDTDADPVAKCMPMGFPRDMAAVFPIQIVSDRHKVSILFPSSIRVRRLFLDRTAHSDEIDPQFNGDSVAHWTADALIVDTANFMPDLWLDGTGLPQSPSARLTERFTLAGNGDLEDRITVDDSDNYRHPWTTTKTYVRRPASVLTDGLCEELSVGHPDWARRFR